MNRFGCSHYSIAGFSFRITIIQILLTCSLAGCQATPISRSNGNPSQMIYFSFARERNEIWRLPQDGSPASVIYQTPITVTLASAGQAGMISESVTRSLTKAGAAADSVLEVDIYGLALSPDKSLLAWRENYQWCPGNYCLGQSNIKIMQVSNGGMLASMSTSRMFSAPTWSPNSQYVVFDEQSINAVDLGPSAIWLWKSSTKQARQFSEGTDAAWAPDSQRIATVLPDKLWPQRPWTSLQISDVQGADQKTMTATVDNRFNFLSSPTWSPDGSRLIVEASPRNDGGNAGDVAALLDVDLKASGIGNFTPFTSTTVFEDPKWSPNGLWVAARQRTANNQLGLVVLDAQDGKVQLDIGAVLGSVADWHWSDNGLGILCVSIKSSGDPRTQRINIVQVPHGDRISLTWPTAISDYLNLPTVYRIPGISVTW